MRFRKIISLFILLSSALAAEITIKYPLQSHPASFAIIVDSLTYKNIGYAVDQYKESIENDGLSTFILINDWKNPEEIKNEIIKLYNSRPGFEGVVFVGDIPIPMLRDAQHLTSSAKFDRMGSSYFTSSVPSDRYYDDFDLKFKFLRKDSERSLVYYYSLLSDSPQRVERDIYSSRVKAPVEGDRKYLMIERYLSKVVAQKKVQNKLDNMMVYTGEGYHSDALTSWGDEQLALREEFPQMFKAGSRIKKINYNMSKSIKETVQREMQSPQLDLAILHAHGDYDNLKLADRSYSSNPGDDAEAIKYYLRERLRTVYNNGESVAQEKELLMKKYNIDDSWFRGAFDSEIMKLDSVYTRKMSIYASDVRKISSQARLIVFDGCFIGGFHYTSYLAGEYIFTKGTTIASTGNTVSTLQDQWADEYAGLLSYGMRFGQWHKMNNQLEAHLFGDPTYRFSYVGNVDVEQMMNPHNGDNEYWTSIFNSNADIPVRAYALKMLFAGLRKNMEGDLVNIYRNESSFLIRYYAIKFLADLNTPVFQELLKETINDPFEFIRRLSAVWMGKVARRDYLPIMAKQLLADESARVVFNLKRSMVFIDPSAANEELIKSFDEMPDSEDKGSLRESFIGSFKNSQSWLYDELIPSIKDEKLRIRKKVREIKNFRIYNFIQAMPELLELASNRSIDAQVRIAVIETLGWYGFAYNKDEIVKMCNEILDRDSNPREVKDEALKTMNRILAGFNNPVTS